MPEPLNPELLHPPTPDRMPWWATALAGLALAGIGFGAWWLLRPQSASDQATGSSGAISAWAATAPEATTTTLALVPVALDPPLLHWPTLLPEGFELCSQIDHLTTGDRFCPHPSSTPWVQVAVKDPAVLPMSRGVPIPSSHGAVWLTAAGDPLEIAVPLSAAAILVVSGRAIEAGPLLEVTQSIPLVVERAALYGAYEPQIDPEGLDDAALAGLMAGAAGDVRVSRRGGWGEAGVYAGSWWLSLSWTDRHLLPALATTVSRPRLEIHNGRPLVVGESRERGRAWALWDHGDLFWRLEGPGSAVDASSLAGDIIARAAALSP